MELRPGYKQTEVGVIPEDWKIKPLWDVAKIRSGGTPSTIQPEYWGGDVLWCTPTDITGLKGFKYLSQTSRTITAQGLKCSSAELIPADSVVMTSRATIGECAINVVPVATNQGFKNLIPFQETDVEFLYYLLQTKKQDFISLCGGSTFLEIGMTQLAGFKVQVPPTKAEQNSIAEALSDVDALIASLGKLIAKKRNIKQGVMQQLLTGKERLPGFSGAWSTISMAKHASLKARIGWQALTTEEYLDNGTYYLVTGTDFIGGRVNWSTCHFVDEWRYNQDRNIQLRNGDILLTKDGTIGKVGYVENLHTSATLNSGVFVIRPLGTAFFPLFLFYVLTSKIFDKFLSKITAGSTINHLYQKDFVVFEFLAPEVDEQTAIATVLSDMDAEIAAIEARREKTLAIKQGMMQALLTGRTRLI